MDFLQVLEENILVADGAMGTLLYSYGMGLCYEELNLTEPDLIKQIHRAYLNAGAQVLQTNTYGANYEKLQRYGLEDQVRDINQAAIRLAQEAIEDYWPTIQNKKEQNDKKSFATKSNMVSSKQVHKPFLLGTIGGVGGLGKKSLSLDEIRRSFREQLYCLLLGNVDGILLETYYDLEELTSVLQIARKETSLPIIAQVSLHEVGIVQSGIHVSKALEQLIELGANVVGINCRLGPYHMVRSLEEVPLPKNAYLSAYPNASLPDYVDGRLVYESDPDYFGQSALALREQGVRLMGGCCGTKPEHIAALRRAIDGLEPVTYKKVKPTVETITIRHQRSDLEHPLHELVKQKATVIVELDTPKKLSLDKFITGTKALKEAGIDAITMADNSLATPRICNFAGGTIVKNQLGVRPLLHIACRDRNLIGLQSHLMGLHSVGIHDVLAVTGDPTKIGDFPGATSVYDVSSLELIQLIKQFNEGLSFSGQPLGTKTSFSVAAAFNPNVKYLDKAVQRLEKKIQAGADFFMSQPLFSEKKIEEVYQATKHLDTPIFIGIMPLVSSRNAEFLHHEVPGIQLTDHIRKRMADVAQDLEESKKVGLEISKSLVEAALEFFGGIYLITPFMRYDMTVALTRHIHELTKTRGRNVVHESHTI